MRNISLAFLLLTAVTWADPYEFRLGGNKVAADLTATRGSQASAGDVAEVEQFHFVLDAPGVYDLVIHPGQPNRLYRRVAGGEQLLAVMVSETFAKEKLVIMDGLKGLSALEMAQLKGVTLDGWDAGVAKEVAQLPAKGLVFHYQIGLHSKGLPPLPSGLEYLELRQTVSPAWPDLRSLGSYTNLRYLRCQFMQRFSAKDLQGLANLEYLEGQGLSEVACLGSLTRLRVLGIRGGDLEDLGALGKLQELEKLSLPGNQIQDLGPILQWPKLQSIDLTFNPVKQVPASFSGPGTPQRVNLLGCGLTGVPGLQAALPKAQIKWSHQQEMLGSFQGVDRIRVRSGGLCHRNRAQEKTLYEGVIDSVELSKLLALEEPTSPFHCMCCGDPTLELCRGQELIQSIGYHHGQSVRVTGAPSDCTLTEASGAALSDWLASKGIEGPKAQYQLNSRRREAARKRLESMTSGLPRSLVEALENPHPKSLERAFQSGFSSAQTRLPAIFQILGHLPWPDESPVPGQGGFAEFLVGLVDQHQVTEVQQAISAVLAGSDPKRSRGAAVYWLIGRGKTWNLQKERALVLKLLEDSPEAEERSAALSALQSWKAFMEVGEWESHVISGMRDPEARVRVKAYKIARLMPSKGLQSELETTARSGKATLRAVSKFAPGEEPNRQVFYTPALKDAQEALLLLAFLKAPCALELATRQDQGPIKELALALLGEPQRLQKRHFESDLEAYALELVLRQRGAYGLEWATAIGFPERQRIVEVLRQHDAPEPGLWAKSPTTWWKKHGTAYQSKMRQR